MMNKYTHAFFLLMAALLTLMAMPAHAQESSRYRLDSSTINNDHKAGQIGAGIQVGADTGLTMDYWTRETNRIQLNLTGLGGNFGIGGSYDWMVRNAFGSGEVARSFVPFVGVGALGAFGTESDAFHREGQNFALAIQVPVGVEWLPHAQRFGVFAQLSPSAEISPYGLFFITGDAGARFYF